MNYTEINRRYISKTRKTHKCEWCGTQIEISSEAWYRFYDFDGQKHSAWIHPECYHASDRAFADPQQDLQDGWQPGEYDRGECISREDFRYPHRSTWEILRSVDEFASVKFGDRIYSSIAPDNVRVVLDAGNFLSFQVDGSFCPLDRDEWVLDDWHKQEVVDAKN